MAAAAQHVTVEAKRLRSDVEARCSALWTELCILGKGAAWATAQLDDGEAAAGVHKAVLQGSAMTIARLLVVDEVLEGTAAGAEKAAAPLLVDFNVAVTVGQIRAVIACFEKKRQTPFLSLLDAAQGKSVDTFGELLSSLNATGEFRISAFRSLNKKVERDSFAVLRDNVAKSAGTASLALPHVSQSFAWFVSAIVAERFRVIISPIPGKAVPAIVARILRECAIPGLLQGRDVVVRVLRQPDAALTEEETAVLEQVRAEALGRGPSP
jgi:hypothetical protein